MRFCVKTPAEWFSFATYRMWAISENSEGPVPEAPLKIARQFTGG
jgi:hypothetical protein